MIQSNQVLPVSPLQSLLKTFLAAFLFIHVSGCKESKPRALNTNPFMINANVPVDPNLVPAGFMKIDSQPTLLAKPLDPVRENEINSGKLFTRVAADSVKFQNYFSVDRPFQLLETGSGVALGDYDNDGLTDIYLVGSDVSNKLYRNKGNFEFENVTLDAKVDGKIAGRNVWGSGATFADIDNDGDLDLFVANMTVPNLMYINQGDGTFLEQSNVRGLGYRGASKIGSFCDYDRDGDLDLYLVTYQDKPPKEPKFVTVDGKQQIAKEDRENFFMVNGIPDVAGERDILYENEGDGTFVDVTEKAGVEAWDRGLACAWFDHDNDGWPDLYVSNDFKTPDHLYRNNGDGTFSDITADAFRHTPWFAMGLDAGDLNNDGLIDLMIGDMAPSTHYQQKMSMGSMQNSNEFLGSGAPRQYMKNVLQINSGVGPYFEMASMAGVSSTDWTWAIRFADMDNDGLKDILVTNGHARDSMNSDINDRFTELNDKRASQEQLNEVYKNVPPLKETNLAFRNKGGLEFESKGKDWGFDHNGISHSLAMADFDNDGDLDMVMNNYFEKAIVYRNDSKENKRVIFEFRCSENNHFGYGTRVDIWQGDQQQTKTLFPARGYLGSDEPILHFGLADSSSISRVKVTWPNGTVQEYEGLSAGIKYRILESSLGSTDGTTEPSTKPLFAEAQKQLGLSFTHQENEFNDYAREPLLPYQLSKLGGSVAVGDVNNDELPDVFCGGAAGQAGKLFLATQSGYEEATGPWQDDAASEDMGLLLFDADNDGDLDLYVVSGSSEWSPNDEQLRDRLYLNESENSDVKFTRAVDALPAITRNGSSVCAADFDRDGDLDLFVGSRSVPGKYPLTPQSQLLLNEGGKFTKASETISNGVTEVGLVSSAIWTDVDGDHWLDLMITLEWGPVTVFKNVEGKLENDTQNVGLHSHIGWWHGVAAADIDEDGDLDYVVTNHGRNTKYHADAKHPHRLYYHDFDDSGTIDLVETKFEGDTELPIRGRSCSSHAMPFIKDKFKTYESFALASLTDIYDKEICNQTSREINWMDSSILWNEDGVFRVESLPYLAQISPAFGVEITDFDGDGVVDLLIANNFFPNQVETGFMDGGLSWFLKGKRTEDLVSKVSFKAVWPNKSGIVLDADSNGLATFDFDRDGDQDVLVMENGGSLRLLENQSEHVEHVQLRVIAKGTTSPIGARITLVGQERDRVLEIPSSGSYLSQSEAWSKTTLSTNEVDGLRMIKVTWPDGTLSEFLKPDLAAKGNRIVLRQE